MEYQRTGQNQNLIGKQGEKKTQTQTVGVITSDKVRSCSYRSPSLSRYDVRYFALRTIFTCVILKTVCGRNPNKLTPFGIPINMVVRNNEISISLHTSLNGMQFRKRAEKLNDSLVILRDCRKTSRRLKALHLHERLVHRN